MAVDTNVKPGDGDPVGARFQGGIRRPIGEVAQQPGQCLPLPGARPPVALVEDQVRFLRAFVPADSDVVPKVFGVLGPKARIVGPPHGPHMVVAGSTEQDDVGTLLWWSLLDGEVVSMVLGPLVHGPQEAPEFPTHFQMIQVAPGPKELTFVLP